MNKFSKEKSLSTTKEIDNLNNFFKNIWGDEKPIAKYSELKIQVTSMIQVPTKYSAAENLNLISLIKFYH